LQSRKTRLAHHRQRSQLARRSSAYQATEDTSTEGHQSDGNNAASAGQYQTTDTSTATATAPATTNGSGNNNRNSNASGVAKQLSSIVEAASEDELGSRDGRNLIGIGFSSSGQSSGDGDRFHSGHENTHENMQENDTSIRIDMRSESQLQPKGVPRSLQLVHEEEGGEGEEHEQEQEEQEKNDIMDHVIELFETLMGDSHNNNNHGHGHGHESGSGTRSGAGSVGGGSKPPTAASASSSASASSHMWPQNRRNSALPPHK
jgi:hypothetical protein